MLPRHIELESTMNTRDLGGYLAGNGEITQFGRILRSDVSRKLTEKDKKILEKYRICSVIDLRSPEEAELNPDGFADLPGAEYYACPFAIGNRMPNSPEDVPVIYAQLLSDHAAVSKIMRTIAAAPGGVLYHCAVGKDRTGVITMLLYLLCGVSISDILADYQVSYTYLREWIREWRRIDPSRPSFAGRSDMEYMEKTLDEFLKQYSNAEAYLLKTGVYPEEITALRQKLLGQETLR